MDDTRARGLYLTMNYNLTWSLSLACHLFSVQPIYKNKRGAILRMIPWWLMSFCLIASSFWRFIVQLLCYCYKCNSSNKLNMVSTRRKRQSRRRFFIQLDIFGQDVILGNVASSMHEFVVVNENTIDQEITVYNTASILTTNENSLKLETLESCSNEKIDIEKGNCRSIPARHATNPHCEDRHPNAQGKT